MKEIEGFDIFLWFNVTKGDDSITTRPVGVVVITSA